MPSNETVRTFEKPQWTPPLDEDFEESKLKKKFLEEPFVPIGMFGTFAAVAYGIHQYKNRPVGMDLSRYLLRLRVIAQGMAVGAILLGVSYSYVKGSTKK